MASHPTRASRRAEGLTTRSGTRVNIATIPGTQQHQQPNIGKKKRPRDPVVHEEDHSIAKKKARIAIEIHSRPPKAQPKPQSLVISATLEDSASPPQQRAASPSPPKQQETPTLTEPSSSPTRAPPRNHHEKVVNGIKHELDRLQPNAADLKDEKRKLRSQEGTRFKSELSAYFPEYDEIIGNEPKEEHILNLDTPITIFDSAKISKHPPRKQNAQEYPLKEFSDYLFTDLYNAQRVDFSWLDKNSNEEGGEDPLSDAYFESIHRKPERQERAIRNTDKGRAQHEKDQVIRLLEGLQGYDWLKLMGVSGITESKKREYEPAREYFLRGCEAIIEKFRIWKELEKQKKLEREAAVAEAEEEEETEETEEPEDVIEEEEEGDVSDGDPPDYSDVDASAARQLHEEAVARSAPSARHPERKPKLELIPEDHQMIEKEFRSFYKMPHLREAALGKNRRSHRTASAWGSPVPDVAETDFDLPEDYRDEETLKIRARRKRRDRRVSKS